MSRSGTFSLFNYKTALGERYLVPAQERPRLTRMFLDFVDAQASISPVHVAFFYSAGVWIEPQLFQSLARRGIWTVIMGLDDKQQIILPVSSEFSQGQLQAALAADLYWTTWRCASDWLGDQGINAWYAPPGADPDLFAPLHVTKDIDVLWIGRGYGARFELLRTMTRAGLRVTALGPGWPSGPVPFQEMIRYVARARIVLGLGGVGQSDAIQHLKGRDFEIPMCGSAYLTSFTPELAEHFSIGHEILCFGSFPEAAELAIWALRRPALLHSLGTAARARSVGDHTWQKRIESFLSLLRSGATNDGTMAG
jgi:hypothetical protein